ncbi:MAG: PqqD family protein [Coxiellaceae bacterium]|nr:PqqD family protein [Coxiellaceae bacterium]
MKNTYKIPTTAIIHEFLYNEVIAANLDIGIYYSMRECSIPVWQLLLSGKTLGQIVAIFCEQYKLPITQITPPLQLFLTQLLDEAMLVINDSDHEKINDESAIYWPDYFSAPVLEKYEEMKDLLMIDPVHEVDEQGWPAKLVL